MIEIIEAYGPQILQYILTAVLIALVGKFRAVSDTNLLSVFNKVKDQALEVTNKEIDISFSIDKVSAITAILSNTISLMQVDLQKEITNMNSSVLAFQEDEIYTKMLAGLSQLDEFVRIIEGKDNIIATMFDELKNINRRLGEMEHERKI
jgi:hypothetical protein